MRWTPRKVGAIAFGVFHTLTVAFPVIGTWGTGESQAFTVALFDAPLVALLSLFPAGRSLLYNGPQWAYVSVFAIGGTLMHVGAGALVGHVVQRLVNAPKP
jgi:hypothetical protein